MVHLVLIALTLRDLDDHIELHDPLSLPGSRLPHCLRATCRCDVYPRCRSPVDVATGGRAPGSTSTSGLTMEAMIEQAGSDDGAGARAALPVHDRGRGRRRPPHAGQARAVPAPVRR